MPECDTKVVTDLVTVSAEDGIDGRIAQANGRLRAAKARVSIERRGGMLWLRGTLPPKPGSSHGKAYRQKHSLGVKANPAGVQYAERQARLMGAQLQAKEFDWARWMPDEAESEPGGTEGEWLERFEEEFRHTVEPVTWKTDYRNAFVKLDAGQLLTVELLKETLRGIEQNSKTRRRCCLAFNRLAKFAGLDVDFSALIGNYSPSEVEPRDVPDDGAIAEWFGRITNPGWRWVYGMMAAFGLRSHEVFYLDTDELEGGTSFMVCVREGKTGRRLVWACYPEWVDTWGLREPVLPEVTGQQHSDFTQRTVHYFRETARLPFTALDLRHRWAIRTLECGMDYSLAAMQMGHSVKVHEQTYHAGLSGIRIRRRLMR